MFRTARFDWRGVCDCDDKNAAADLLRVDTQTPRILVVLLLPGDRNRWITITQEELVLRHSAYWASLRGADETMNRSSLTVRLPVANLFDVDGLRRLMEQSRNGRIK